MHTQEMVQTHPRQAQVDRQALVRCIEECYSCAQSCTTCADACLGEEELNMLVRCIRLNLDCANVCYTTGQMLSRQTEADWDLLRLQLQVCAAACEICGAECRRHANHHEHCRVCAEACRRCEDACSKLLAALPRR
jgi:hypothetical protein